MKKFNSFCCFVLIIFINTVFAQETIKFKEKSAEIDQNVKIQVQKIYFKNNNETEIVFNVLSKRELKTLPRKDKIDYSRVRVKKLGKYFADSLLVDPINILFEFSPIDDKKIVRTGSNANYRDFSNRNGIYRLVILKREKLIASGYINDTINGVTRRSFKKDQPIYLYGSYTEIYIPENSFICDCDAIKLELKEFFTPSEMLLAGLTTTSGGKTLITGGMIHIMAYCNGKEIKLKKGATAVINFYTINESFGVFFGKEKNNIIDWTLDKDIKTELNSFEFVEEMESGGEGLKVLTDKLGWINCDAFPKNGPKTELLVDLQKPTDSTYVRLIFLDMKSILPGYFTNSDNSKVVFKDIPKGKQTHLLVYKIINKTRIYWAISDIETGKDTFITDLKYQTSTKEEFKKIVDKTW